MIFNNTADFTLTHLFDCVLFISYMYFNEIFN